MTNTLNSILAAAQRAGLAHNGGAGGEHLLCANDAQLLAFASAIATAPAQPPAPIEASPAARDVLAERARQIHVEGCSLARDDRYVSGELSAAAAAYLSWTHGEYDAGTVPINWPWDWVWFKPADPRRNLVKAGALILAEIERIDRRDALAAPNGDSNG